MKDMYTAIYDVSINTYIRVRHTTTVYTLLVKIYHGTSFSSGAVWGCCSSHHALRCRCGFAGMIPGGSLSSGAIHRSGRRAAGEKVVETPIPGVTPLFETFQKGKRAAHD